MSPVAPRKPVAPVVAAPGVPFGSLAFYSSGFLLPEGRYCMYFNTVMYQFTKADGSPSNTPPRLGVMVDAYRLEAPEDVRQQFLSMGSKAHLSFQPSADGKGLSVIPGGPAASLSGLTGWNIFLKSLYDTGMPEGTFVDSLVAIDGVHVATQNIPEPEERKGFASSTGEVEQENRGPKLVPVVSEILESGKPWLGTGGVPEAPVAAAPASPARPAAPAKPAARVAGRIAPAAPAPVAAEVEAAGDEDLQATAINAITAVLTQPANAMGCTKIALRTSVFKTLNAADKTGATGNAVLAAFFNSDDTLNSLLGPLGYVAEGPSVKVIPG